MSAWWVCISSPTNCLNSAIGSANPIGARALPPKPGEPLTTQLSTGVRDMFVNGVAVLRNGVHTGAKPGVAVRGPGYRP